MFDMAMMKGVSASSPDAYVEALSGWQRECVEMLRTSIHAGAVFREMIKWTNLVFLLNGPCIVIRAEERRVILALFRGKRLTQFDQRIRPSGKFELANLVMVQDTEVDPAMISQLAAAAAALNLEYGDPTARH
jgi:hypothetical protein